MTDHAGAPPTGPGPLGDVGDTVTGLPVVDLDTCADEPIRIPGSVQPHGVLLAVSEPDLRVRHVSANVVDLTGVAATEALGRPLADVLGAEAADVLAAHLAAGDDLRVRNPVHVRVAGPAGPVPADAVLHRLTLGAARSSRWSSRSRTVPGPSRSRTRTRRSAARSSGSTTPRRSRTCTTPRRRRSGP
ncbi:PAS domain-containing protein [Cellulomonas sp. FA1]|uniref:PAS domain-containing protein n=1 Tax=Cellulomonas sp. FA1 TaxID=1346710 RepID=UPI001F43EF26|nr:PAS domain-containing protein [Cellulomonas sp. FA1]